MSKDFVTKEELTKKRTPKELRECFECKIEEIIQQEGGKKSLRMRKGLCKEFIEEVYPLSILASIEFEDRNDIMLQPVIGNQNYDALIFENESSSLSMLEITQAQSNDDYLKREMLDEKGYAPISGCIKKQGTKNTSIKFESNLSTRHPENFNEQNKLISEALSKKNEKGYDSSTSLLIMFQDIGVGAPDEEYVREKINRFIKDEVSSKEILFSAVYFVSWSKKHGYIFDFCL
ncbi:hypothetical protein [Nostoc sp. NMS7]|nr:hypothetical protein [Nostoc sp. NMS7]